MTAMHTPGPWQAIETPEADRDGTNDWRVLDERGLIIAEFGGLTDIDRERAILIASAPDLVRQRDALLAALRLAERNTAARIYMLPRTARVLDSQALETELATYRAAIAACQPKEI